MSVAALLEGQSLPGKSPALTLVDYDHLGWLESEAIHILREVAGQCRNPALLFSGGKDSLVLLRLAEKAFRPGGFPFPLLHIDTGHNFPEVIAFRDHRAAQLGERLIVRSVEDSIASGRVELRHPAESRNRHQSVTLLDAIAEFGFDAIHNFAIQLDPRQEPVQFWIFRRPEVWRENAYIKWDGRTRGMIDKCVSVRFCR